jgi:CRP-like cAMP-binding protein/tetratricopeptide (TPR) repeat protein
MLQAPVTFQPKEVLLSNYQSYGLPSIDALFKAAWQLRAAGRFSEAAKTYEMLLEERGDCKEAVLNLGVCYMKLGEIARARRLYIQSEVKSPEITYNYAVASLLKGKKYQAITALRECSNEIGSAVSTDAKAALLQLEATVCPTPLPNPPSELDFDFSMVIKKAVRNPVPRKKYQSLSLSNSIVARKGFFSRSLMPSIGNLPLPSQTNLKRQGEQVRSRPKSSFQMRIRSRAISSTDQSSVRSRPVSVSLEELQGKSSRREKLKRQGSLVEVNLENEADLKGLDMEIDKGTHQIAAEMNANLDECLRKQQYATSLSHENELKDINRIRLEMSKPGPQRSLTVLSFIVSRLKFFAKFKPEVREELLRIGTHLQVPRNQYIFRQGDLGSQVYVVLHGSVSVWRHAAEYGSEPLIVHTLYEGDSFGELSLFLAESTKRLSRSASCQAVEDTDLYALAKEEYYRIMVREVEIGLQAKLSVLLKLPFFMGVHEFSLVPLAATLTPSRFKIGQYILRTGEVPQGLHIVVSGRCSVYAEGYVLRPKHNALDNSFQQSRKPAFSHSNPHDELYEHIVTSDSANSTPSLYNDLKSFFKVSNLNRLFSNFVIYRERVLKTALSEGGFFSGRCLTAASQAKVEPGKYAVVAESAEVVIYVITGAQVPLLGEKIAGQVFYILNRVGDVDCPAEVSREKTQEEFAKWNSYKGKLVARVVRQAARDEKHVN